MGMKTNIKREKNPFSSATAREIEAGCNHHFSEQGQKADRHTDEVSHKLTSVARLSSAAGDPQRRGRCPANSPAPRSAGPQTPAMESRTTGGCEEMISIITCLNDESHPRKKPFERP